MYHDENGYFVGAGDQSEEKIEQIDDLLHQYQVHDEDGVDEEEMATMQLMEHHLDDWQMMPVNDEKIQPKSGCLDDWQMMPVNDEKIQPKSGRLDDWQMMPVNDEKIQPKSGRLDDWQMMPVNDEKIQPKSGCLDDWQMMPVNDEMRLLIQLSLPVHQILHLM